MVYSIVQIKGPMILTEDSFGDLQVFAREFCIFSHSIVSYSAIPFIFRGIAQKEDLKLCKMWTFAVISGQIGGNVVE